MTRAVRRYVQSQEVIYIEKLAYSSRYYDVLLKHVAFIRDTGQASFSMLGEIVSGKTINYWFSTRHENNAKLGSLVHARCLSMADIETAIKTGKLNNLRVFL